MIATLRRLRRVRGWTLVGGLLVLAGCGGKSELQEPPNVLVIVLDTVRADRLSTYGYGLPTSPILDALAEESTLFTNAYSTSSWTAPSHASLFTGLFPVAHRVTQERWRLEGELVTLAEVLEDQGYFTFGLVENAALSGHNGFDQGFQRYLALWRSRRKLASPDWGAGTVRAFERVIDERDRSRPFFGFVNLVAAHSPYQASPAHREILVSRELAVDGNQWGDFYRGERVFSPEELHFLNELYDASIRTVDATAGAIVAILRERRLLDRTLLVITSDHGENLGDHDHIGHVFSLYETTLRVPLLMRLPGVVEAGAMEASPVQLTDVPQTVLAVVGVDASALGAQGRSLLESEGRRRVVLGEYYRPRQAARAMRRHTDEDVWPAIAPFDRRLRTVIHDDWKLIWGSDGRHELYDLAADPGELRNLIDDPRQGRRRDRLLLLLERSLELYERDVAAADEWSEEDLDEETVEALKALGYLQ